MLNFGICLKCIKAQGIEDDFHFIEFELLIEENGRVKNNGPCAWGCPALKDANAMVTRDGNPPENCIYISEQILFFDRAKGKKYT